MYIKIYKGVKQRKIIIRQPDEQQVELAVYAKTENMV